MTFIVRMLRYLFWLAVVSWSVALLRRVVGHMAGAGVASDPHVDGANDAVGQKLVRDPVCGMHLAEELALPLKRGGEVVHFCSETCRDKYLGEAKRFSASA
jgi:YHS domain-containing protein